MTTDGFPELAYEPKCRVCQLAKDRQGFLRVIHDYRRKEGLGNTAIKNRIKDMCVVQGIKPIDDRNLGRHFDKHVNFTLLEDPTDGSADLPEPVEEDLKRDELEMLRANSDDMALGRNDSDYHNMVDLFRRLMRRITALDADPMAFITDDGKHHAMQRLNTWKGMIDSAARILSDLNKMRNQDKMTVSILENHTRKFAMAVAAPIGTVLRDIRDELLTLEDPKAHHLAARIDLLLTGGVTEIFTEAATRSLRQSKEQYKLLN